uniref:Uncharacterized protein n=1 Tax=Chromera velia CCMP2878 TaxID=1169474 RepID=A0A0G4FY19_9ALVE|eukprot:Cvel_19320.t1-p1 / transcript=Cvel_19320.t1 / gene=Cvel_19320 / organism=Chromera_velia_CCMP2878 / gene_product=hypothetical protein / transcript_product=hypothetical protein / location=Cvel_scaffold1656:33790-35280(-) / protein_length=178 / sequence_SO=supercontig / SO=protein_coding / is_pseudo=false
MKIRFYPKASVQNWTDSDEFFLQDTPMSDPLCLTGTVGVKHLLKYSDEECNGSVLEFCFGSSGKLLCPMDGVKEFRASFRYGITILFLSLFQIDMLNVVVMQVMLINSKSFKKSWKRFLSSFLLSTTEGIILALLLYGFAVEDNQDMSLTNLYFSVVSTALVILWKCLWVLVTHFNIC